MRAKDRLIVALDLPTLAEAEALVDRLGDGISHVKVGLELYLAHGPGAVHAFTRRGLQVMLDLKLHDIDATVARATARVADLGAGLLTIHTGGGPSMMVAAARAILASGSDMRLLGVTVLTSMSDSDLQRVGLDRSVKDTVAMRAKLALDCGVHGVVASPLEAAAIRASSPSDFLIVTPGVRPAGAGSADQKRVATPAAARNAGADYIVVGRPIRDAEDPAASARAILSELG